MAPKITDPVSFLKNLVSRKGRSDMEGVYLCGATVLADALEDYGYTVDTVKVENEVTNLLARGEKEWNSLLVSIRLYDNELVHPITFVRNGEEVMVHFITEDHDISCLVFIPKLEVGSFESEVTFFLGLLRFTAQFAGKTPTTARFTIGAACTGWDDMVEEGYAKEHDIAF
jgi:hypothetical protein